MGRQVSVLNDCSNIAVVSMSNGPNRTASFTDFNEFLKFTNPIRELNLPSPQAKWWECLLSGARASNSTGIQHLLWIIGNTFL